MTRRLTTTDRAARLEAQLREHGPQVRNLVALVQVHGVPVHVETADHGRLSIHLSRGELVARDAAGEVVMRESGPPRRTLTAGAAGHGNRGIQGFRVAPELHARMVEAAERDFEGNVSAFITSAVEEALRRLKF